MGTHSFPVFLCAALSGLALAGCSRTTPLLDVSGIGPMVGAGGGAGAAGGGAGAAGGGAGTAGGTGAAGGGAGAAGSPPPNCQPDDRCDDALDNDCDGVVDEGCRCGAGESRDCYTGPRGTRDVGVCRAGTSFCDASGHFGPCRGEVTPTNESCGNEVDEDCNGTIKRGCGTLECPDELGTPAGVPVALSVRASNLSTFTWEIVSAPAGGDTTAVWASGFPQSSTETVTLSIVGDYQFHVTASEPTGELNECSFRVRALPHGLRVQLYWDGPGDVDLHLHNDVATPWFISDDCYYGNTQAAWGATLSVDNTTGDGPENIRVDNPTIGATYTIGVHDFAGAFGRKATVEIFCGNTAATMPLQTFVSRPFVGSASGSQCTENDFWRVAAVRVDSADTCSVTPIDAYGASSDACNAFAPAP